MKITLPTYDAKALVILKNPWSRKIGNHIILGSLRNSLFKYRKLESIVFANSRGNAAHHNY